MGNCALKAVTDSAQGLNEKGAVRTRKAAMTTGKTSVEVLPRPGNGVWKVKLAIDQRDLERILSEEVNTEALIEQMRIAANSTPVRGRSSWNGINDKFVC